MKNKLILGIISTIMVIGLTGCSLSTSGSSINKYKEDMTDFFDSVERLHNSINSIDTEAEGYEMELLTYLDQLDILCSEMAEYEVPATFVGVAELADDASKNMSQAVSLYHSAYGVDFYNVEQAKEAYICYVKASHEINYILRVLHGEKYEDILKSIKEGKTETINFDSPAAPEDIEPEAPMATEEIGES